MASVSTNRRQGLNSGAAVKVPCKAATTANITLSGEQTIDGVSCVDGDRVLVWQQTTGSENGIYVVSTSSWQRDKDFDGVFDVVKGTLVHVTDGTTYERAWFEVTTSNPITPGSTTLTLVATIADAANVQFTPSGTGMPTRKVSEKLGDVFSPQDAGWVPSGTLDLATANGLIASKLKSFGTIDVPAGSLSAASRLWSLIDANQDDIYIIVLGDSTGNETTEWVYLWATYLGVAASTHTISYRLWVDGSNWDSATTISTGSGSKTIYIDNVSIPGSTERSYMGERRALIYDSNRIYDLAFISHGHNEGTSVDEHTIFEGFTEAICEAKLANPSAQLVAILQNPRTDFPAHSARVVGAWRKAASVQGIGLIDVYSEFQRLGSPSGLYTDTTHPSALGQKVWAGVVLHAMGRPYKMHTQPAQPYASLNISAPNFIPNPAFNQWDSSNPTGVTISNVTAVRDYNKFESGSYSVLVTATSTSGPSLQWTLTDKLALLRGHWVTFAARVWYPDGAGTAVARAQLVGAHLQTFSSTDTTSVSSRTTPDDYGSGGWIWAIAQAFIREDETNLTLKLLCGSAVSDTFWVDRVSLVRGLIPFDVDHNKLTAPEAAEFYSDQNVGFVSTFSGDLTVADSHITLANGSPSATRVYIDLFNLVIGGSYTMTWTDTSGVTMTVFIRDGAQGNGSNIASASASTETVTWTATKTNMTVLLAAGTGVSAFEIQDVSVTQGTSYRKVTQATSKSTTVILNTAYGQITMNNAALAADAIVSFTLTNSAIEATDTLILNHISGGTPGSYVLNARAGDGSATIDVANRSAGSLSEAVVIAFKVIKADA